MNNISFRQIQNNYREMANGQRNCELKPLTEEEIEEVKREIIRIGAEKDIDIFIFNDEEHIYNVRKGTGYNYIEDKIYITKNVFPETVFGSTHPRDLMSIAAVLAHEYYGHRPHRSEYLYDESLSTDEKIYHTIPEWQDECRASIEASKLAPNLSNLERAHLIQDAIYRAYEAGQLIEMDDYMKGVLYGYNNNGEKNITPAITKIKYVSKSGIESNDKYRECNSDMPEMSEQSEDFFDRE